ncbi:serine/threonine-protein phosphatase [Alcaligenaceae bacterium A4P071]|nr:serine/threonine-protein phosphatase [Alcaligenaceae bacterium A4P071]
MATCTKFFESREMSFQYMNESKLNAPNQIDWLTKVVLKLPSEARSSLRIDALPLVGFTDVRHMSYGNQDRIAAAYRVCDDPEDSWLLAVVCDGVGGSANGERAAALTVASLAVDLSTVRRRRGAANILKDLLHRAHIRTSAAFNSKSSTTAVACLISGGSAVIGWVGDSRAYQISDGEATQLTIDDTLASAIAKTDSKFALELNEEYGERLSQAVGGDSNLVANVIEWLPSSEEAFCILCSDGVWKPVQPVLEAVVGACSDGQELMRRLLILSDWTGGHDNASAIMLPPFHIALKFLNNTANATPDGCFVLSLPGNQSIVMSDGASKWPMHGEREFSTGVQHATETSNSKSPARKSSSKRKGSGSTAEKGKSRPDAGSQLVIAEEPTNDESTSTTNALQSDEPRK